MLHWVHVFWHHSLTSFNLNSEESTQMFLCDTSYTAVSSLCMLFVNILFVTSPIISLSKNVSSLLSTGWFRDEFQSRMSRIASITRKTFNKLVKISTAIIITNTKYVVLNIFIHKFS